MKELPLYLQPGGYIKRAQNKADRLQKRSDKKWQKALDIDLSSDSGQKQFDRLSSRSNKLAGNATSLQVDIDSGTLGSQVSEKRDRLSQGFKTGANITAGVLNTASNLAASNMNIAEDSSFYGTQQVGQALSAFGPYGALAGAALTGGAALAEGLGVGTAQINKSQAEAAGLSGGQRILNNIAGILAPGIGVALGKTMSVTQKTAETQAVSGAYADAIGDIDAASSMGDKRYVFGKDNINNLIAEANRKNAILTEIGRTNTLRKQSDYGQDLATQNQRIYAGTSYAQSAIGKNGMKIASVDEIRRILELRKQDEIQAFQNGGVIEGNILPTGKLHKELHRMEDVNPELAEDLTRKGIPVVVVDEDGSFQQVAEIERDEWTTSKEVTDVIEKLWKDGSEEAMLECGKFICEQLLSLTRDDNNLLGNGDNTNKD